MTIEHLKVVLNSARDSDMLWQMAEEFVWAEVLVEVQGIRLGRMTALRKSTGGVRGIVAGDTFRRAVSRTVAQQIAETVERATAPFQYALSTRAGSECVGHAIQALTDVNPDSTVLSVDGIGAFDLVSREAMLSGLRNMEGGAKLLPFVAQFYGQPSQYIWEDDEGVCHTIPQGEGGEQGDPLMPALFSLGQHSALQAVQDTLRPTECLLAFLDDIYLVTEPARIATLHRELAFHLWTRAGISLHAGKTQIWNKSGRCPPGCEGIFEAARVADLDAVVWKGDQTLPTESQGLVVLGAPLGHADFVAKKLRAKTEEHTVLLQRILAVQDLHCAWASAVVLRRHTCQLLFARCTTSLVREVRCRPMMSTCGVVLRSCWASRGRPEFGSCRIYRSHWEGWVCEARFVAGLPRIGPAGHTHSQESGKDILGLLTSLNEASLFRHRFPEGSCL